MKKIKTFLSSVKNIFTKNKSTLSLFVIMLVITILTSAVSSLCNATELTKTIMSASVSTSALMGIGSLEDLVGMKLGDTKRPAILGIIIGIWLMLI